MKHIAKFIIVFYLSLTSCKEVPQIDSKELKVIDVAGGVGKSRQVYLSEIADTIDYIPLETTPASLLTNPSHERILYEKGILNFTQKNGQIKLFNSKGEYISTLNKLGRGPQEYETLGIIHIDNASENIIIKSINKIVEYSLSGKFIRTIILPTPNMIENIVIRYFLKLGDRYFFCGSVTNPVIITDSSLNVIKKLKYPLEELDFVEIIKNSSPSLVTPYIYLYKDRIRLINGINKYVLSIDKDLSVDTVFIIDYGKYSPENNKSGSRYPNNSPYLWRYRYFFESNNYLFMRFHIGSLSDKPYKMLNPSGQEWIDPNACALFNKETEEFTFLDQPEINQIGFVDDIEGGPGIWPMYVSADNYMISYIPADEFIAHAESHKVSEKYKTIAAGLKETDNYVFVRVKLK